MKHIIESHEREFQENGITNEKIPNLIKKAAKDDQIVRTSGTNRPVYETKYNGKIIHTAITINSNGYIACAHIATRRWKEKKIKMKIIRLLLEYGCILFGLTKRKMF